MRALRFLILSISFFLTAQTFALAQVGSTPFAKGIDTPQNEMQNLAMVEQVNSVTAMPSSQVENKSNSNSNDVKPHILKAGEYDAAYNAYIAGEYKQALTEAQKRADIGDPAAMTLIGKLYMDGRVVEKNSEIANEWFKKAADLGDPHAALHYGLNLFNGINIEADQVKGSEYIKQSMQAGVPDAYLYYGQILMAQAQKENKIDVGLTWFLKGAVAGDPYSAYSAADLLANGTDKTPANDYAARALLESSANAGNVAAQLELARWMYDGRGGPKNYKEAFTLIKLVAVNDIPIAQVGLARFYFNGIGTEKNPIMGASWYLVAQQGKQGANDLDALMKTLTPKQLEEAQARSATLLYNP